MLKLQQINKVPDDLLTIENSTDLHTVFSQPTIIHLQGKIKQPLFISVLLHANEDTGLFAIQALLERYQDKELPRSISIFFGNMAAAKQGVRRLDGQPDYNRIWPGTELEECPEIKLMQEVVDSIAKLQPFASIDIHNNTGKNPHYGCINNLEKTSIHLASLFSRIVVYFKTPKGVQSMAMSKLCPSVTLECGKPHLANGIEHATDFLETVLHLETLEPHTNSKLDVDIYHTVARITIPKENSFTFANDDFINDKNNIENDIVFAENIDQINFTKLPENTVLGHIRPNSNANLVAWNDHEKDVTDDYFSVKGTELTLTKSLMPAMLTLDKKIIRQDCLCYLMENINVK